MGLRASSTAVPASLERSGNGRSAGILLGSTRRSRYLSGSGSPGCSRGRGAGAARCVATAAGGRTGASALRRQVPGHGLVRGLQRGVEPLPQRATGGAAQAVELLPARAHGIDELGPLLARQLDRVRMSRAALGGCRQRLGLLHGFVACPPAGPVLPTLQLRILSLQGMDAPAQGTGRCAAGEQPVDLHQVPVCRSQLAGSERGLRQLQVRGQCLRALLPKREHGKERLNLLSAPDSAQLRKEAVARGLDAARCIGRVLIDHARTSRTRFVVLEVL